MTRDSARLPEPLRSKLVDVLARMLVARTRRSLTESQRSSTRPATDESEGVA